MTRKSLRRVLTRVSVWLIAVLVAAIATRAVAAAPSEFAPWLVTTASVVYAVLSDMVLVLVTIAAAYLTDVFQRRSMFVQSLREEWRRIVATKTELVTFCDRANPALDTYLEAYACISSAIDSMRIVYRNVGETGTLVGLYPYEPLHDMRRALATLDPRRAQKISPEQRALVRDAVRQSFNALREAFLDELDLSEPAKPIIAPAAKRLKVSGTSRVARKEEERQYKIMELADTGRADIDAFLADLCYRERASEQASLSQAQKNHNA